jgi:hypothetical protein
MYPQATVEAVLVLRDAGMTRSWIARELDIPPRTVSRWLERPPRRVEAPRALAPEPYAYLLGLYLGDGHISTGARGKRYLTLSCDAAYPGIVESARAAMTAVVPGCGVWLVRHPVDRCVRVGSCSRWWPVLFPQHGAGRKHERPIVLAQWQRAITGMHPRELIRGLIASDGSRFVANQRVGERVYRYTRYAFSNRSAQILGIFCEHLDLLGVRWTQPNDFLIAIDRRSEVAKLDAFVGPKR